MQNGTLKFPDVVDAVSRLKKTTVSSFVLDCELVAYDRAKHKILPFQVLRTRARKDVAVSEIKVHVCIFSLDLLYLNGQALLQENLKIRREHLYVSFEEESGSLQFATSMTSNNAEEIQKFVDKAVDASCEGIIIKTLNENATYQPSQQWSLNWIKLKKFYMENTGDTLDLVPIGANYGQGKRTGGYGAILVACFDNENEEFQTICKIGTGFSDEFLEQCTSRLCSIPNAKPYYRHPADIEPPDVWLTAREALGFNHCGIQLRYTLRPTLIVRYPVKKSTAEARSRFSASQFDVRQVAVGVRFSLQNSRAREFLRRVKP